MITVSKELPIVGGSVELDVSIAGAFIIELTENINNLAIVGAVSGFLYEVDVLFKQDLVGGRKVTLPENFNNPQGVSRLIDPGYKKTTRIRFVTNDGGNEWRSQKVAIYDDSQRPIFSLPTITGENSTFNDECESISGWSILNASISTAGSILRYIKSSSGASSIQKIASKPPATSDHILYARIRATYSTSAVAVLHFYDPASGSNAGIWLGSANATTTATPGCISMVGTTNNGTIRNTALMASGNNYSEWIDIALHWDSAFSTLCCSFREADGRWKLKGRVYCEFVGSPTISAQFTPTTPAGSMMEIDYLTICRPNIMANGDSICAGATLFNPNPSAGLANDESTWMRHAPIYPSLRNNLIVQRGIPGNTSAQILSRLWSITASSPQLVFLHASTNDAIQGVSQSIHKANIQSSVDTITVAGSRVVLLNQIYGTVSSGGNVPAPVLRDYGIEAWKSLEASIVGASAFIDIMYEIKDDERFIAPNMAQADGHPNIEGYRAIGALIAK